MTTTTTFIRPGIDYAQFAAYIDQVYASLTARRISELEEHAATSGQPLPMPANVIVAMEDAGAVVDLTTGMITWPDGIRAVLANVEA